ncbi:MAG: hypothetical protein A2508_01130 [Candidatus Lambdaproteobacteria bacterium RIFOXYD12_FULL_49_8]|nr:MAG: hypothetical protein A2508_01130 [Candidatus Lambdaproteobacteria bacterium RIFOXYD12_FULL_49_8]
MDLVREMILVATGEKLTLTQKDIKIKGHAIECRINAEDPATFVPSPGLITAYHAPGGLGVRVDSAAYQGWNIPPYYDSMIAKVIAYSDQRSRTIQKLIGALEETVIEGVKVNIPLHLNVLRSLRFQEAELSTAFLENFIKS